MGRTLKTQVGESWVLCAPYTTSLWAIHIQRPHSQANAKHMVLVSHQHPLSIQASCPDLIWEKLITVAMDLFLLQAKKSRREWVNSSSEYREEDREEKANRNPRDSHQSFRHGISSGTRPTEHEGPSIWLREEMALNGWQLRQEKAQLSVLAEIRGFSGNLSHLGPTLFGSMENSKHHNPEAMPAFPSSWGTPWSLHFLSSALGSHHSWEVSRYPH